MSQVDALELQVFEQVANRLREIILIGIEIWFQLEEGWFRVMLCVPNVSGFRGTEATLSFLSKLHGIERIKLGEDTFPPQAPFRGTLHIHA